MNRTIIGFCFFLCSVFAVTAQTSLLRSSPDKKRAEQAQISELLISPDTVSELHLRPNFATSILMPEPVANVVLGAPMLFSEEHSEHAAELVVVKPITDHAATSNLLVTTRSGQHVSLTLVSDGSSATDAPVDFVLIYRRQRDFLIPSDDPADALAGETLLEAKTTSVFDQSFSEQQRIASPAWSVQHDPKQPLKIAAAVGSVSGDGESLVVAFSLLNVSSEWVEILPPQIELNNPADQPSGKKVKKKQKNILADQVPITDYRYTQRKLAPGARADGVVKFERPNFKQSQEKLQLELATADAANHPLLLNLPFTPPATSLPHPSGE